MEQKESGVQKKDEACGNETSPGMAGLCRSDWQPMFQLKMLTRLLSLLKPI
ncbi:hypothetical protein DPMN_170675 [Dreissena polymorpha]|uniref:RNF31 C-terminal domain-containing protein n=1 Tax=Dreissena polymorpha TaxID=45954 RepID=A0A9D4DYA3_DREPO|nr:hypothetical protein DPMN_170675 [Dreissena polymorpha]